LSKNNHLIVVLGPTAVGKTALCIELANYFKCDIVSADSRQFYREMEIGTAKPTDEELELATHHFINSHSIEEDVSAGIYEKLAIDKLNQLYSKNNVAILTGGSGLYINAVTDGMSEIPKISDEIREELNKELSEKGLEHLVIKLKRLDPDYAKKVDVNNPQRIIRALEVCIGTGKTFSSFRDNKSKKRDFNTIKIGLNRPRKELYERINERMDIMIHNGLFEEAEALYEYRNHNALQTVGYKEVFDYIDGVYDEKEAVRLLKRNSRRYAKRQLTWFGKDEEIKWFEPNETQAIVDYIKMSVE